MAISSVARDDEQIRLGLERWLRSRGAGDAAASITAITRPPAGLSSDTCFVTVANAAGESELVVRLAPLGGGLFPHYDLAGQAEIQNALRALGVPVAAPAQLEVDPQWLGAAFVVMPRVAGQVLPRSYLRRGWMVDASPELRARVVDGLLRTVAAVHRLPPVRAVDGGAGAEQALVDAVARWDGYLDWATGAGEPLRFMEDARAWCVANRPAVAGPAVQLWGDVQLTNAVFGPDGSVRALLDWEMAGVGPPELDLGWFLALHEMTVEQHGATLAGIPTRTAMVDVYQAALGRDVRPLQWYEAFALLRSGSIMVRMARVLAGQGVDDSWLHTHNPTAAALDRVMGRG